MAVVPGLPADILARLRCGCKHHGIYRALVHDGVIRIWECRCRWCLHCWREVVGHE